MTGIENIKTATPAQIDTVLADLLNKLHGAEYKAERTEKMIEDYNTKGAYYQTYIPRMEAELVALDEEISDLSDQIAPLELEYRARGGWTRAFIVQNSNGHIHSSMSCNTCFPTTSYGWLTQVSGLDEAEIVDQAADMACTVCYPTAPALPSFAKKSTLNTPEALAAKAARDAEKAARAATKAAKSITDVDGSVLRFRGDRIETLATAWSTVAGHLADHKAYGYTLHQDAVDGMIKALAAKLNTTEADIKAQLDKKVAAKIKRDAR